VVEAYQPALALAGRAGAGEPIFQARCATCHRAGAVGQAVGPDLATLRGGGREKLLLGILDPNREVAPNFAAYTAETRDGESLTGVLVAQGEDGVTLRLAGGAEVTVARSNLAALQGPGRSLMPEGLEAGLTAQDLADLMEFILAPGNR
jgi:putative heme-binding domain-containing protein